MITLSDLVSTLMDKVPQKGGKPADYEELVLDSVMQVALDASMLRVATLTVTAGVATYNLPADFLLLVELLPLAPLYLAQSGGVSYPFIGGAGVDTASGLVVPLVPNAYDGYEIVGTQLTFIPTPSVNVTRQLRYAANFILDEDDFPTLTPLAARAVLLYGRFLGYLEQSGAQVNNGWSYALGSESVNKTGLAKTIAEHAAALKMTYDNIISRMQLTQGSRATYDVQDWYFLP